MGARPGKSLWKGECARWEVLLAKSERTQGANCHHGFSTMLNAFCSMPCRPVPLHVPCGLRAWVVRQCGGVESVSHAYGAAAPGDPTQAT